MSAVMAAAQSVVSDDYPQRYRDTEQNLLPDSTASATVVRWSRGGDQLVVDSLFKRRGFAKHFASKRFMDHAFLEGNIGLTRSYSRFGHDHRKLGTDAGVRLAFGDWFTPEHGWAIGVEVGNAPFSYKGVNATYMLNMSALAAPDDYTVARRVEVYGLAGIDGGYVNDERTVLTDEPADLSSLRRHMYLGMHLGLRGQWNSRGATYLFLQPELRAARPARNLIPRDGSGYDVSLGMQAGLGWRVGSGIGERSHDEWQKSPWYSHTFIQAAVGLSTPAVQDLERTRGNYYLAYPKYFMAVGKWFNPRSGLRLWGEGGYVKQMTETNKKAFSSVGADYIWNITNTFDGYKATRRLDFIAGAGFSLSHISMGAERAFFGLQGSLQMRYRFNRAWSLFVEPQVRLYKNTYLSEVGEGKFDPVAAVLLGTQITSEYYDPRLALEGFRADRRHWFISLGAGAMTPMSRMWDYRRQWSPLGRIAFGHWFTPLSGWRFSGQGNVSLAGPLNGKAFARAVAGGDYLFDATTFARGYEEDRIVDVRLLAGLNIGMGYAAKYDRNFHFMADIHAGAQMAVRVGPRLELYAEPQLGWHWGEGRKYSRLQHIYPTAIMGLNYLLEGRDPILKERPERRHFVTAGIGTGFNSRSCRNEYHHFGPHLTVNTDATYGQWWSAHSGWQVGFGNSSYRLNHEERQNNFALRADYLLNLLALLRDFGPHDERYECTLVAGFNYNFGFSKTRATRYAQGLELGMQLGWRINEAYTLYLQPLGHLSNHRLYGGSHKLDGGGTLLLGLRYGW